MSFNALAAVATGTAEAAADSGYPNHWVIGGTCLAILLIFMLVLVTIGKGREHT